MFYLEILYLVVRSTNELVPSSVWLDSLASCSRGQVVDGWDFLMTCTLMTVDESQPIIFSASVAFATTAVGAPLWLLLTFFSLNAVVLVYVASKV